MTLAEIYNVYQGSDGEATKALYARLEQLGPLGHIAANLFRAHKNSARAKVYRGGGFRGAAYDRKGWALRNITDMLITDNMARDMAGLSHIQWGWGEDPAQEFHRWVLYVDLPTGQVSFHAAERGDGPDYPGKWDGSTDEGAGRICRWIVQLLETVAA